MSLLTAYLEQLISTGYSYLAEAVNDTAEEVLSKYILRSFVWGDSYRTGMLLGHVQSGKTSHVLGVIAKAADEGFNVFLLLTTDSVYLQQQTFERAIDSLNGFNVCTETDELRFIKLAQRMPTVIVLKKNAAVLKSWQKRLAASGLFPGNPMFIVDDEADASSLNTKTNKQEISTINSTLRKIKNLSKCGVYLQLTATPQSLLLQTTASEWKPQFIELFKPGNNYIGGDFFFSEDTVQKSVVLTEDQELQDLLNDDELASNGLMRAVISFLISSAHLFLCQQAKVCNFVVHPSVKIGHHELIADKVGEYLNHLSLSLSESDNQTLVREVYDDLRITKPRIIDFITTVKFIQDSLKSEKVNIRVMNSNSKVAEYSSGMNILIGGNSLGRGITFPMLQTIYYCRTAKLPQADTVWQHCRMFGYDRDPDLVRAFMPPRLYKVLAEMNSMNNSIFIQAHKSGVEDIRIYYSDRIKPTRKSVIDQNALTIITGGVNYFPFNPHNQSIEHLDESLSMFDEQDYHVVSLNFLNYYLELIENDDPNEWSNQTYMNCIKAYSAENPAEQGILIVRRNRDISQNTGTLLSPNDRLLGKQFPERIVLTLYKVTGNKGWGGLPLWIPNIKFPDGLNFFDIKA